jgi:hypothetical protein
MTKITWRAWTLVTDMIRITDGKIRSGKLRYNALQLSHADYPKNPNITSVVKSYQTEEIFHKPPRIFGDPAVVTGRNEFYLHKLVKPTVTYFRYIQA